MLRRALTPKEYTSNCVECMEISSANGLSEWWPDGSRAYAAALDAEEKRRGGSQVEPVPPEGVTVVDNGTNLVVRRSCKTTIAHVGRDGRVMILHDRCADPDALEYVAALSRYRAAQHAAGDRARLEKALEEAALAESIAFRAHKDAEDAWDEARAALTAAREAAAAFAARKEAGL